MMTPSVKETRRTHHTAMRLVFLVANDAWCFTWGGEQLLKLHGAESRFYTEREDAVSDAQALGLDVTRTGLVYVDTVSD